MHRHRNWARRQGENTKRQWKAMNLISFHESLIFTKSNKFWQKARYSINLCRKCLNHHEFSLTIGSSMTLDKRWALMHLQTLAWKASSDSFAKIRHLGFGTRQPAGFNDLMMAESLVVYYGRKIANLATKKSLQKSSPSKNSLEKWKKHEKKTVFFWPCTPKIPDVVREKKSTMARDRDRARMLKV